MGCHRDHWLGVVVQVAGAKDWQAGEGLTCGGDGSVQRVRLAAGDALVLPKGIPHVVTTPADPGSSVHLVFAFYRDRADGMQAPSTGHAG